MSTGPTGVCEIVVTGPDMDTLAELTRVLVDERLCACGHLIGGIRSVYRWQGEVHDDAEARVALHTRVELIGVISARVAELHPYDVPCVLALDVVGGAPDYLDWVRAETLGEPPGTAGGSDAGEPAAPGSPTRP